VFPVIPAGGIQAAVIAVAERAADLISGDLVPAGPVTGAAGA
jgi:choline dehydrogenase-like flavoprotein